MTIFQYHLIHQLFLPQHTDQGGTASSSQWRWVEELQKKTVDLWLLDQK